MFINVSRLCLIIWIFTRELEIPILPRITFGFHILFWICMINVYDKKSYQVFLLNRTHCKISFSEVMTRGLGRCFASNILTFFIWWFNLCDKEFQYNFLCQKTKSAGPPENLVWASTDGTRFSEQFICCLDRQIGCDNRFVGQCNR
jgi:hypothetical protein